MHKPHFQLNHLSEILGDKISSDQTPDEINSLGRVLGIPISADVVGKVLVHRSSADDDLYVLRDPGLAQSRDDLWHFHRS